MLQDYGKLLNEPLAELYIYAYISDRSNDIHGYYVEDLKNNDYYDALKSRLKQKYPEAPYTKQFINELESDRYMLSASAENSASNWTLYLFAILFVSLILNAFFFYKLHKKRQHNIIDLRSKLSKQEQVVLDHLLQNKSNKDIAEALFLSVSTIKTHINNIYKKLNVQSRDEAKSLFSRSL